MKLPTLIISALAFLLISCSDETAQWRGPNRDGIYPENGLLKEWPEAGPDLILKIEGIGKGLSQAVLYKNIIYVTGLKIDSTDVLSAYDLKGNLIWDKAYSPAWDRGYPETRSTPTIEKNRIYLLGGSGLLVCLDAKNGNILWQQNPLEDFNASIMHWGIVESILLTPDAALCLAAGDETTLVAYDKITGEFLWKSESLGGEKPYASSSLIEWNGMNIVLVQTSQDLMGIDADNGEILWNYNTLQYHDGRGKGEAANTPLYRNGEIFVTYGNDQPGMLFSLAEDGRSVSLKWSNDILDTHHGGLVLLEGNIYGSNSFNNSQGDWASVDWETGKTNWETEWFTKGSVISADGLLYFYEEKGGNLALIKPDSEEMKIVSSFRIQEGKGPHWAHPSIYDGKLLIRHGSVLLVYNIKE
jgi:outer membrane protein assembly factor BamB